MRRLRGALPWESTPLVGRDRELLEVRRLMQEGIRVLTLCGPGGVGKSRVAVAVAASLEAQFRDGAVIVDVSSVRDGALIAGAISRVLGVREDSRTAPLARLLRELGDRHLLIVLDNCEQIERPGGAIGTLVDQCRGVSVLAISRRRLGIRGEHLYGVDTLELPAPTGCASLEDLRDNACRSSCNVPNA